MTVDIQPSGRLWGGGGGGEFGADGSQGSAGTCQKDTTVTACNTTPSCPPGSDISCTISGWLLCIRKVLLGPWQSFCGNNCVGYTQVGTCRQTAPSLTPATVIGGNGGLGRGFNNFSGSLLGSAGPQGNCPQCADSSFTLQTGTGSCGGQGGTGGLVESGVKWFKHSMAGSGGLGGNAISGTGFTVVGNLATNTVKGAI